MPTPRFQARDYVVGRGVFGIEARPRWVIPAGGSPTFLWASVVHHVHAWAINDALKAQGQYKNLQTLCKGRNLSIRRINEALIGTAVLRMEIVGMLAFHLGPGCLPDPRRIDKNLNEAARDTGLVRPPAPT